MAWRRRGAPPPPPPPCPDCGAPLALRGRFCKACGYDADLAESDDAHLDGVDIPDGYAEAPDAEARYGRALDAEGLRTPRWRALLWAAVGLLTAAAVLLATLR